MRYEEGDFDEAWPDLMRAIGNASQRLHREHGSNKLRVKPVGATV